MEGFCMYFKERVGRDNEALELALRVTIVTATLYELEKELGSCFPARC